MFFYRNIMKINSVSPNNSNSFKSLDFHLVYHEDKPYIRKNLGMYKKLAEDCDIKIWTEHFKSRTSCLYNHGFVISCKPLKETIANKNLAEDIEVKSTYIPAEQEKLSLADCIKNSVKLLKKKIGL